MTPKLVKTLDFIEKFYKKYRYMPSVTEIGKHFKISAVSAWERLQRLESKGFIEKEYQQKRAITICHPPHNDTI